MSGRVITREIRGKSGVGLLRPESCFLMPAGSKPRVRQLSLLATFLWYHVPQSRRQQGCMRMSTYIHAHYSQATCHCGLRPCVFHCFVQCRPAGRVKASNPRVGRKKIRASTWPDPTRDMTGSWDISPVGAGRMELERSLQRVVRAGSGVTRPGRTRVV